jgi:hypothetical protein
MAMGKRQLTEQQADRASIAEIRKALGGHCDWVMRRLLKRVGSPSPDRQQTAQWAESPPEWFPRERERRATRATRQQAEKVTVACPGCGFAIRVRPATALHAKEWDGLHCGRRACGYRPPPTPPGLVTETTWNAVGSFSGWRHVSPDDEQVASAARAGDLATAALAMQPGSAARAVLQALVVPAGPGDHLVTIGSWSTSVTVDPDGSIEIENPVVCGRLHRMVIEGDEGGIIVRSFTREISHTLPNGTGIPVKEVRGWHLSDGVFYPLDEQAIFAASCTDAGTGEPIAPERGVRYADAYPVAA